ncbi:MAG: hypothetical protein AB4372_23190 [Xenococcus sp. (in: cyanobacteria)]
MSRPGGNPDLVEYQFTTDREESCTAKLQVRVPPSMLNELKGYKNWQEIVRQVLAEELVKLREQKETDKKQTK